MNQNMQSAEACTDTQKLLLMYPSNQLKDQQRKFIETQTAFSVVKEEFFSN